jgi:hypothetical protein
MREEQQMSYLDIYKISTVNQAKLEKSQAQ